MFLLLLLFSIIKWQHLVTMLMENQELSLTGNALTTLTLFNNYINVLKVMYTECGSHHVERKRS